jgi:hypothetical protein
MEKSLAVSKVTLWVELLDDSWASSMVVQLDLMLAVN